MMMLEHPPLLIFQCSVKMKRQKSNPTMFGNMPLISYLDFLHFTLMEKASENGSNINMDDMGQFSQWHEKYLAIGELSTSFFENLWDKGNPEFLKTNSIKNQHMLWKYLHHQLEKPKNHPSLGIPCLFYFQNNSVISPG